MRNYLNDIKVCLNYLFLTHTANPSNALHLLRK